MAINFNKQQLFGCLDIIVNPGNFNPKTNNKDYNFTRLLETNIKTDLTA